MQGLRKTFGLMATVAFLLFAGSVICLASGQPIAMTHCGDQMPSTATAAVCPYMSVSIPAINATAFGKDLASLLLIVIVAAFAVALPYARNNNGNDRATLIARSYTLRQGAPPASYLNATLDLISKGVLHSRIYGF